MGPKLLFFVGIVLAHGTLAAGWVRQDAPKQRVSIATCVQVPETLPHFAPPRELLARVEIEMLDGVLQP